MKNLKKILLATDFSKSAGFALKRAAQFAKQNKTTLTTLHIFPQDWIDKAAEWLSSTQQNEFLQFKREAKKAFDKNIKPNVRGIKKNFIVKMGRESDEIIRYAKEKRMELLIIGSHGHYFFHEYFLGTTAESIVRHAPCPVLVVKKKPTFQYRKILVPIDFSSSSQHALAFACQHFPKATIELLHVEDLWYDKSTYRPYMKKRREGLLREQMREMVEEKVEAFLEKSKFDCRRMRFTLRGGYPAAVIAQEAKNKKVDLVIMGTRGETNLRELLLGSVAAMALQEVTTDVMAIPPCYRYKKRGNNTIF